MRLLFWLQFPKCNKCSWLMPISTFQFPLARTHFLKLSNRLRNLLIKIHTIILPELCISRNRKQTLLRVYRWEIPDNNDFTPSKNYLMFGDNFINRLYGDQRSNDLGQIKLNIFSITLEGTVIRKEFCFCKRDLVHVKYLLQHWSCNIRGVARKLRSLKYKVKDYGAAVGNSGGVRLINN